MIEAWQLAALEELGMTTTSTGLINRVARALSKSPNEVICIDEFRQTCYSCGVDPDSFSKGDLDQLQRKLNELT